MNMQKLMQEAQKMQVQLQREQEKLETTVYEGNSSLVHIKMNGKYQILEVNIEKEEDVDLEMLEDMILIAVNDASKKIHDDKEKKMDKYGKGLAGLM